MAYVSVGPMILSLRQGIRHERVHRIEDNDLHRVGNRGNDLRRSDADHGANGESHDVDAHDDADDQRDHCQDAQ